MNSEDVLLESVHHPTSHFVFADSLFLPMVGTYAHSISQTGLTSIEEQNIQNYFSIYLTTNLFFLHSQCG